MGMLRRRVAKVAVLALVLAAPGPGAASQDVAPDALRRDIDFARSKVYPALVNISVVVQRYSGGRAQRFPGAGSGVIISAAGHVLTNFHVAGHTTRITCTLPTGERVDADVIAHDPLTDLSVLGLRLAERPNPTTPLPFATLGDSDALRVGDYVLAMGNPMTLSSSLTLGVVSNPNRVFTDFTGTEIAELDLGEGEKTGVFTRWVQHDSLILPGNSGGPLVNLRGEVVGINELGGAGLGFAIPSNLAAGVLNQVLTFGEVRRGWLGVAVLPVGKIGLDRGALVSSVAPSSPAREAGLRPGDVILRLDGRVVDVEVFEEVPVFYRIVAEKPIGADLSITYLRDGDERQTTATVARMEKFLGQEHEQRELGLTVREITGPMALARQLPTADGVMVTGIRPGYPFEDARPPLRPGDIIVALGRTPTPDFERFREAYHDLAANAGADDEVAVEFYRDRESVIALVEIGADDQSRRGGELPKAWFGFETQVLLPGVAAAMGLEGTRGFRVTEVFPWTTAEAARLRPGDVIVALDSEPLEAYREQDAEDLRLAVEEYAVGEAIELSVIRAGERLTITVETQARPEPAFTAARSEQEDFEFTVREVTFMDRVEHKLDKDQRGVLVADVTNGGWAHMAGLRINDLVMRIGGAAVEDIGTFESAMEAILAQRPDVVEVFLQRNYRTHFIFIEPVWPEPRETGPQS